MKRVLIAGPGRSGSSVLVATIGAMGISSSADSGDWFDSARAGFEATFDPENSPEVVKDPLLTSKLPQMLRRGEVVPDDIRIVLIPFRDLDVAAASRWEVARRAKNPHVAGGLIGTGLPTKQAELLARELWHLLLTLEEFRVPYRLLHYPRFMFEEDYFLDAMRVAFPDVDAATASAAWHDLRDPDLVRSEIPTKVGRAADVQAASWVAFRRARRLFRKRRRALRARLANSATDRQMCRSGE